MPDFSYKSKFNKEANFSSILFGADAPLLETELNELQSILLEKIRDSVRAGFKDGVINSGEVTYDGNNFTMKDFLVVVDGDIFYVSRLTIPVSNGQKIYLTVEEEEVDYQSILRKYGNRQETNIDNHMYDDRVNQETSRRQVITYDLTTSKPIKGIEIGEIINGEFKATYFKSEIGAKENIGIEKPQNGGVWYELIERGGDEMAIKKVRIRPEGGNNYADILHPETSADVVKFSDGSTVEEHKAEFDEHNNDAIRHITSEERAKWNTVDNKVDKVSGKGLSTEDYTTAEKNKLAGIEAGAQVNTVTSVAGKTGEVTLSKSDVGLSNVDNVKQATKTEFDAHKAERATLEELGHVEHGVYNTTLDTSWSGSSAPYSKTVTVSGILATDTPIIDVIMSGTYSTDEAIQEAWGYIYRAVTDNDSITFYATEKPTVSLPIQIKVVR